MDEYEQAGSQHLGRLADIEKDLDEVKHQVEAAQLEIELLNPDEQTRGLEIRDQYNELYDLLRHNQRIARQSPSSRLTHNESAAGIKLPRNALNQPTSHDPLDRKEVNPIQGNKDQTPPTETIAATQMPIPSHTTRSSPHDTRNVSTTRDRTTTFAASASQPSDSTLHNVLNQPIAPDPLDREERNPVQGNDGHTPPTENTTLHVTPDMDIISENLSPGPNVKNSPSPWPRGATPASDPKRDNLHVITTMTNHLIVGSFQNAPADLNTCPLNPRSLRRTNL